MTRAGTLCPPHQAGISTQVYFTHSDRSSAIKFNSLLWSVHLCAVLSVPFSFIRVHFVARYVQLSGECAADSIASLSYFAPAVVWHWYRLIRRLRGQTRACCQPIGHSNSHRVSTQSPGEGRGPAAGTPGPTKLLPKKRAP